MEASAATSEHAAMFDRHRGLDWRTQAHLRGARSLAVTPKDVLPPRHQTGSERERVVPPLTARFSEQSKFDALEAQRTSGTHAAATSAVPKKSILNLGVNFVEPLLRSVGPLSIGRALGFQFCNPIFGGA